MGKIYVNYPLVGPDAELTNNDIKFEISVLSMKVQVGSRTLDALTGRFFAGLRAGCTWWNVQEGATEEEGKRIYIIFQKYDHMAWRSLFKGDKAKDHRFPMFERKYFGWSWVPGKNRSSDGNTDNKITEVKAESPLYALDVPDDFSWQALCIGLDDFEDSEDYVTLNIRLDPTLFQTLCESVTIEELFEADVTDKTVTVYFRVYESASPFVVFQGELEGKCMPQFTLWEFVESMKCTHPAINGYTSALQVVLTKTEDTQGKWARIFSSAKHASEFHAPASRPQGNAAPNNMGQEWSGPILHKPAITKKFRALLAEGVPAKDATLKAIAYVKTAAAKGEAWAIEK